MKRLVKAQSQYTDAIIRYDEVVQLLMSDEVGKNFLNDELYIDNNPDNGIFAKHCIILVTPKNPKARDGINDFAVIEVYEYEEIKTSKIRSAVFVKIVDKDKMPISNTKMTIKNCSANSVNIKSLDIDHRKWHCIMNSENTQIDDVIHTSKAINALGGFE